MRAVFLHGFGADCLSWLGNQAALPEVEKIALDLRGHGKSLGDLQDGSIEDLAHGVLDAVGDGPPAWLVGHSLGGGVALWLAAHYPERWKGLFLLAPLGLGKNVDMDRLKHYPEMENSDEMMRFLKGLVADPGIMKPEFAAYALSQLNEPGGRDALREIIEAMPASIETLLQLLPSVAETGLDVTVYWGTKDDVVRPDPARIEQVGALIELPEVGHVVHVEAMNEINAHLRQSFGLT
jgi:pyruvate dehydrogenase E2 component (dihydrolipoamide acetyltransferase)